MPDSDFWSRHVFVLFSSDAPYRGVHTDMVNRLRKEGFPPVAARALHADPELIDDLYADLIAGQWQTWRYRLVDAVLALGPAMALICRYEGDTPPQGSAHDLLALRKGYQHPEQAEHGTLRRDFGAVNSIVGLMHSSDGPVESEREAAIFGLTAADAADPLDAAAEIDYLCQVITPHLPEHRDFDQVLAAVRTRVVAALWEGLPAEVRHRVRERFPETARLGDVGAGAALAALLTGHAPDALLAFLACEFEPSAAVDMRMSVAEQALRTTGVVLDAWERVVLESSLHFQPLRASRQAGR